MAWKRIPVFISSTFRDMNVERDVIKISVRRRLNEYLRRYKVEVQFIDLRIGVNTEGLDEDSAENEVLDVCLTSIDRTRPYFIGLLGQRYGWIPPKQRWHDILTRMSQEKRALISEGVGRSVTELEIMYGALGNNYEHINHSLFYMRSPQSYAGIPDSLRPVYIDDDTDPSGRESSDKLKRLKAQIQASAEAFADMVSVSQYTMAWDPHSQTFTDTSQFEELVYEQLKSEIEKDIETESHDEYYDDETANVERLLTTYCYRKVRTANLDKLTELRRTYRHICITGDTGAGKSTLLAQAHADDDGVLTLTAFAGSSESSQTMSQILTRWNVQLMQHLGDNTDIETYIATQHTPQDLSKTFDALTRLVCISGRDVHVYLDNIDYFEQTEPDDLFLLWLNDHIDFVGTAHSSVSASILQHNHNMCIFQPELLDSHDIENIIRSYEQANNLILPATSHMLICQQPTTPLRVALLMILISNFTTLNINEISNSSTGSEIDKINGYITSIIHDAPHEPAQFFSYCLRRLVHQLGLEDTYLLALTYIAISEIGLCEDHLQALLPTEISFNRLRDLVYILEDFIGEHAYNRQWYFKDSRFADAVTLDATADEYLKLSQLTQTLSADDPVRHVMAPYYTIKGQNTALVGYLSQHAYHTGHNPFELPKYYFIKDSDSTRQIIDYGNSVDVEQRVNILTNYINALGTVVHPKLCLALSQPLLDVGADDTLSTATMYQLAYTLSSLGQLSKYDSGYREKRPEYYRLAETLFHRCYQSDPTYRDTRNMLKAIMIENLDEVMKTGDWGEMERRMNLINSL